MVKGWYIMFFSTKKKAHSETVKLPELSELTELHGTFRGFSPSDSSPNALGELEVVITADSVKFSHATGLIVDVAEYPTAQFKRVTQDKISAGSSVLDQKIGFQLGDSRVTYFFIPIIANNDDLGLIIKGSIADYLGPTMAFGPKHIRDGIWQETLNKLEEQGMPLLKHDGKILPESYKNQEVTSGLRM